jgi:hypothetical protein
VSENWCCIRPVCDRLARRFRGSVKRVGSRAGGANTRESQLRNAGRSLKKSLKGQALDDLRNDVRGETRLGAQISEDRTQCHKVSSPTRCSRSVSRWQRVAGSGLWEKTRGSAGQRLGEGRLLEDLLSECYRAYRICKSTKIAEQELFRPGEIKRLIRGASDLLDIRVRPWFHAR